ncbi:NAD-dependent epimerase/dehydratase family protein [Planctomycetota bacterium]
MLDETLLENFKGQNVLVTGGTGMIGRQLVGILLEAGACVKSVSLDRITVDKRAEHIVGDLAEFSFCRDICRDMDYVCHVAGIGASVSSAKTRIARHFVPMLQMNTNMLEAARLAGARRVVFTSSVGAYANADVFRESDFRLDSTPMDFGGWAKRMAEAQVYAYQVQYGLTNFAVVRPPNVYGPGDNFHPEHALVVPSLMYRIHRGDNPLIVWGDGTCERDFVYSRDVAEGVILALWHGMPQPPGFINLGSGGVYSVRQLVETLHSFIEFEYEFDASKPSGVRRRCMDISLAREYLGYNPTTTLVEGLHQTWDWFANHPNEYTQKQCYFEMQEVGGQKTGSKAVREVDV